MTTHTFLCHPSLRAMGVGLAMLAGMAAFAQNHDSYQWQLPKWVPQPVVPKDNPMSSAKVELGRHLFYDKRLSANTSMSCATCHIQALAFTDGKATGQGIHGEPGVRSAMPLANAAYWPTLTWANPNLRSLETQALLPIFGDNPVEMGMAGQEGLLFERLRSDTTYQHLFKNAFAQATPSEQSTPLISIGTITKALGAFQRSLLSFNSPYDQYKYGGKTNAISAAAKRGENLFFGEKLECYHCHGGFTFSDNVNHVRLSFPEQGFHNTGLYNTDGKGAYPRQNTGIFDVTGNPEDMGKFRTPSLRNIERTAPYMHDGSVPTLKAAIEQHYAKAGRAASNPKGASPLRSELIAGFKISPSETHDLIAFLKSLTDQEFLKNPVHSNPWPKKTP